MKRKKFGRFLAATLLGAATLTGTMPAAQAQAAPAAQQRPRNVIFIIVDDLRYDGMGFLQPRIKTPNIDRMARGGTYFPNTVVTSSLCSPSRATILTGQSTRNHGIVDNNDSSESRLTFFPSYLQQAGYQTAFIGKWHMGAATDAPRPGFDKWISFAGQGFYYPTESIPAEQVAQGKVNMLNVDGQKVPQRGYITDELTDYALNWLAKERDPDKPFFLYFSHKAVHSDPLPPPRYAHQYDGVDFPLPASAADTPENRAGKPMWVYNQRNSWHGIDFFYNSDMTMSEYLRYYYATLSGVDDSVGRIMTYLKKNGLEKDTLLVFTSDNGFQIGEHGLIDKRTAYEPSVRVPMIMYSPGTVPAGQTNPGLIRNLDYAPTFLDLAGVARPSHFEGKSAWPLITGSIASSAWAAPDFIYEYYWEWTFPMTPTTFSIRRGNFKYILYHGVYDRDELYDLSNDPDEMHNLAEDPAYVELKVTLRAALYEQLGNSQGDHVIPYTARMSIGAVRRRQDGTGAAPFPDDWHVEPNRPDRVIDMIPDGPHKPQIRPHLSMPILGQGRNSVDVLAKEMDELSEKEKKPK